MASCVVRYMVIIVCRESCLVCSQLLFDRSPDMWAPTTLNLQLENVVPIQAMYQHTVPMHWESTMSLFVMNRLCEFVRKGTRYEMASKKCAYNLVYAMMFLILMGRH
jgi:hypothetical protein